MQLPPCARVHGELPRRLLLLHAVNTMGADPFHFSIQMVLAILRHVCRVEVLLCAQQSTHGLVAQPLKTRKKEAYFLVGLCLDLLKLLFQH